MRDSVAIVGAGLAGSLLARALGPIADVTLFERGGPRATRPPPVGIVGDALGLPQTFCYGLGGTTNLWSGSLLPMLEDEFTTCWPEAVASDLGRYHEAAVSGLYGPDGLDRWGRLERARVGADLHVDQSLAPMRPARVARLGMYRQVELELGCQVRSVEDVRRGVVLRYVQDGRAKVRRFDRVVLASGGLNSPLLLRRSALGGTSVGEHLTDHPTGFVAKLRLPEWLHAAGALGEGPESKTVYKLRDPRTGLWSMFVLCPTDASPIDRDPHVDFRKQVGSPAWRRFYGDLVSKVRRPERRRRVLDRLAGREGPGGHAYVLVFTEQEPQGQGSVRETPDGRMRLDWRVSPGLVAAVDRSLDRLARGLAADLHRAPGGTRARLWSAAHHSGGCRIALHPRRGVVDADLRVHGTEHVYVCDGSVLPSTGASNTGLTIAALALRLAAHLGGRPPGVAAVREREVVSA